jgi:hypothetical protein
MILAQLTPEMVKGVPYLLVGIGALLWITNQFFGLSKNVKGKPSLPPNEHLEIAQNTLRGRMERVEEELSDLRDEMKVDREANRLDGSKRSKTLFDKLDTTRLELKQDLDKQTAKLETQIEGMPDRIITLLKNIGVIGHGKH